MSASRTGAERRSNPFEPPAEAADAAARISVYLRCVPARDADRRRADRGAEERLKSVIAGVYGVDDPDENLRELRRFCSEAVGGRAALQRTAEAAPGTYVGRKLTDLMARLAPDRPRPFSEPCRGQSGATRRSPRLSSHPPGYFQRKPAMIIFVQSATGRREAPKRTRRSAPDAAGDRAEPPRPPPISTAPNCAVFALLGPV